MNFNHLQIFYKVAQLQHFTRAAEALFISQPAVSKQIHELEKSLGQSLFTRTGQKVYLTEAGRLLYEYAERIFTLTAEAEIALDELQGLLRGHLSVGASTTIGTYLLPDLLGQYTSLYPQIHLSVKVENTSAIEEAVLSHQLELGLVEGKVNHAELEVRPWRYDALVLVSACDKALEWPEAMTLQQFMDLNLPLVVRESGSGTRTVLEEALLAHGVQLPVPLMELGSTEAIKRVVSAGLGYAFISQLTIELEVAAQRLRQIPLSDFELRRPLYLIFPRRQRFSKAAEAFLQLL
ncbi:LysR family transcriptional regulator [Dictyobacter halimunensis]